MTAAWLTAFSRMDGAPLMSVQVAQAGLSAPASV
jgi:hypothetical protein